MTRDAETLTPAQRRALRLASRKGGVHVGLAAVDGAPPPEKRVTKPVALTLVEQGLARQDRCRLNILPAGRAALNAPTPHEPVYLRERDGLTNRRELSVRDEPEVQDTTELRAHWRDDADARQADTEDRRAHARRLARSTRRQEPSRSA